MINFTQSLRQIELMKIDTLSSESMKKFLILLHIAMADFYEVDDDLTNTTAYLQHQSINWLDYLVRAENRYVKFLTLMQKSLPQVTLPPIDVLLMWLMHLLLDFNGYFEDMFRLFGANFCLALNIPIEEILQNWTEGQDYNDSASVEVWESYTNEPYRLKGYNTTNMILPCPNCEADCSIKTSEFISFRLGRFIPQTINRPSVPCNPEPCKGGCPTNPVAGISSIDDVPAIQCGSCKFSFTKETISAKRFVDDLTACMSKTDRFVAGTVLDTFTNRLDPTVAKELILMLFDFKEENVNTLYSKIYKSDPWTNIQHQLWRLENLFFVRSDLDTFSKYNHIMRHVVKVMPEKYSSISPLSCDLVELWSNFKYFYELIWKRFPMLGNLLSKDLSREARCKILTELDFGVNVSYFPDLSPVGKSFRSSLLYAKDSFEKSFRNSFFKEPYKPKRDSSLMDIPRHKIKAINVVQPLDLGVLPQSPVSAYPPLVSAKDIDFDKILMRYHQYLDLIFNDPVMSEMSASPRMQYIPDIDILVAFFTHIIDTEHYLEFICGSLLKHNEHVWSLSLKVSIEEIKRNVFMAEKAWKERFGMGMISNWQIWK
eukprot:NODE_23_length_38171_cov_0.318108.p6 type:complete len:599 gc:universal NODE_23_length_38171_cov_0.318108:37778-35982(-)